MFRNDPSPLVNTFPILNLLNSLKVDEFLR